MSSSTIRYSGLPGNSQSGANQDRRPDLPAYLDQVLHATDADYDSPGAYRYDPESHDPSIRDSDPRSPRHEPPHLRHRPGDTWIIDRNRPEDPYDPGPYGSPGWQPDRRTGRHRRGELPDATSNPASNPVPDPAPDRDADRAPGSSSVNWRLPGPAPEGTEEPPAARGRSGGAPPQPPARPRRRYWGDDENDDNRYDFGRLREQAWTRFLVESEELSRAHVADCAEVGRRSRFWEMLRAFWLRCFGIETGRARSAAAEPAAPAPAPPIEVQWRHAKPSGRPRSANAAVGYAKVTAAALFAGPPREALPRTNPVSSYLAQWERHFDATHGLREAVVL